MTGRNPGGPDLGLGDFARRVALALLMAGMALALCAVMLLSS